MRRILLSLSLLAVSSLPLWAQANGKLQIHYMNVGQGDGAVLISPQGAVVLFDLGVKNQCGGPLGYLQGLGLTKIDDLIVSHYHSDHIGCAQTFLSAIPLTGWAIDRGGSYSSAAYSSYVTAVGGHRRTAVVGERLTLDASSGAPVYIDIVAANGNGVATADENDLSVVALVRFGAFEAVFGGDIAGANSGSVDPDPNPDLQTLTTSVTGSGTLTSSPGGINCPGTCAAPYAYGTEIALTPSAASGWTFAGWSGACTGTGPCTVTMTTDRSVTARFTQPTYGGYPACTPPYSPTIPSCGSKSPTLGCDDGMFSCAATTQGACSGHSGVKCVVCPGALCPGYSLSLTAAEEFAARPAWTDAEADVAWPESYADLESSVAATVGQVEVYKVHHHGSRYSSNDPWVALVHPMVGIVSVGAGNTYGHPTMDALGRIHSVGTKTYWTSVGNGVAPKAGWDYVGGDLVIEVGQGATAFTVRSSGGTQTYPLWGGGSTPISPSLDTDSDGLPNAWEETYGLGAFAGSGEEGPTGDPDHDGRTNLQEYQEGGHPRGFFTRYLAEGATSDLFALRLAFMNPSSQPAHTLLRFLKADGSPASHTLTVAAMSRVTVEANTLPTMAKAEFSTVIESDQDIVIDRTMSWDSSGYGSHAETSIPSPATTWYLAEGATHSGFDLFYLIQNPNPTSVDVQVRYLLPAGPPLTKQYSIPPNRRFNIWVDTQGPALANTDVSAVITTSLPTIVERAMYLNSGGLTFGAGHESAGVTTPATEWFLAEGATGDFFDLFVLVANPNPTNAAITATFLLPDGSSMRKDYTVAANTRFNIWVDTVDARLANTAVSTIITSTNGVPLIVERAMWWPGPTALTWAEAHNSAGLTSTGRKWGLADGEVGGSRGVETYILIANRGAADTAKVTLLYEDGTTDTKNVSLPASSRTNVAVASEFPNSAGRRFGAVVEALGSSPQIIVERAMYSNAGGMVWAAGTNAGATRLQ